MNDEDFNNLLSSCGRMRLALMQDYLKRNHADSEGNFWLSRALSLAFNILQLHEAAVPHGAKPLTKDYFIALVRDDEGATRQLLAKVTDARLKEYFTDFLAPGNSKEAGHLREKVLRGLRGQAPPDAPTSPFANDDAGAAERAGRLVEAGYRAHCFDADPFWRAAVQKLAFNIFALHKLAVLAAPSKFPALSRERFLLLLNDDSAVREMLALLPADSPIKAYFEAEYFPSAENSSAVATRNDIARQALGNLLV